MNVNIQVLITYISMSNWDILLEPLILYDFLHQYIQTYQAYEVENMAHGRVQPKMSDYLDSNVILQHIFKDFEMFLPP